MLFNLINTAQAVVKFPEFSNVTNLGSFIASIYTFALSVVGIILFVRFIYAGFLYLTNFGDSSKIAKANNIMKNAVMGTVILFSAYLILYVINPDLVCNTFDFGLNPSSQQSQGCN